MIFPSVEWTLGEGQARPAQQAAERKYRLSVFYFVGWLKVGSSRWKVQTGLSLDGLKLCVSEMRLWWEVVQVPQWEALLRPLQRNE